MRKVKVRQTFWRSTRRPLTKVVSPFDVNRVTLGVPLLEIIHAQQAGSIPKLPTTLGVTTMMIVYSVRLGRLGTAAVRETRTDLPNGIRCEAVDASGEYVGWCECEQGPSSAPSSSTSYSLTPAPAAGTLGSDGARKTTIHYLGAATLLFLAS